MSAHAPPVATQQPQLLAELLATEERLAARIAAARTEAAALVADAETRARTIVAAVEEEIASALRELEDRLKREEAQTILDIHSQAEVATARYETVDEAALAQLVVDWLLSEDKV